MTKEDIPPLGPVPKKRRQLEAALDVHVAMWLASDDLTPSERRRVEREKQRRRELRQRGEPVYVTCIFPREGLTPPQRERVVELAGAATSEELRFCVCGGGRYRDFLVGDGDVPPSSLVLAAPKEMHKPERAPAGSVWEAVRYAKHRGIAVTVVLPDGATDA